MCEWVENPQPLPRIEPTAHSCNARPLPQSQIRHVTTLNSQNKINAPKNGTQFPAVLNHVRIGIIGSYGRINWTKHS